MLGGMSGSVSANGLGAIPPWVTPELLALTREAWQPYYPEQELTQDDLLGLLLPVGVLYELLSSKGDEHEQTE